MSVDQTTVSARTSRSPRSGGGWGARIVRGLGWTLIAVGSLVLLFLVYLLWWTDVIGAQAQDEVAGRFELEFGDVAEAQPAPRDAAPADAQRAPIEVGSAYAAMEFLRDGEPILHDEPLYVVEGTDLGSLGSGPGHYVDSAAPGEVGNLGIAGHRTTRSRPFYNLEQLAAGDVVRVVDRDLAEWRYEVRETRIVSPADTWVIGPDPLGEGGAWLTLTTCHPRFSNAQRMVVFAELVGAPRGEATTGTGTATLPGEDADA